MQLELYTVYDLKSKFYVKPFYMVNRQVAMRDAMSWLMDSKTAIHAHPEDYVLFYLGTFEDTTCQFNLLETPETVCRFHELTNISKE